jgi:Tol biopolymer transport system component/tRNA A-37 threonylcarbamoyl transferase component Bud32
MSLDAGTRLGPYEIVAPLGAGGMGEVWRARDPRLDRDVAIKALPDAFAADPERLARFEREAKLLASLSHPNVAGIHGLELAEGHRYLVLELVEGETLAARLARGPLPLDETMDVGRQIAAAVEAAHETGVVHRDLKPGNIMLRPDGTVKVLDFGLAKGAAAHGSSSDLHLSASPTMSYAATAAGVILGTAAYMSPEQARGKTVDRRTDIWSFGCVLYECLTGRRAYEGETVSDMVARILEREPDWGALPATTPLRLRELLRRCLAKDMKQRLQAIGEARIALESGGLGGPEPTAIAVGRKSPLIVWAPWVLAAALAAALIGRGLLSGPAAPPAAERRVEIEFPRGQHHVANTVPVISPDGRQVALVAADSTRVTRLWLRSLDSFEFRALKGTEGAGPPFWSPDSRSLAFQKGGAMHRLSLEDGAIQTIVTGVTTARGGDWSSGGEILYTPGSNTGIWRVPAAGGTPRALTQVDTTLVDASHRYPVWLPDGKHFLYTLWSNNARVLAEVGGIYLGSVDDGAAKRVLDDDGAFILLSSGHLLVRRNGDLTAVPFDLRSLVAGAPAVSVAEQVGFSSNSGSVRASASADGDLAFTMAEDLPPTDLAWIGRDGKRGEPLGLRTKSYSIILSPDGTQVVAEMSDPTGMTQLWAVGLARGTVSRLTRDQNDSYSPAWSPDGRHVAFSNRDTGTDDLYIQLAAGTRPKERVVAAREVDTNDVDWSADGRYLFFTGRPRAGRSDRQVWAADLQAGSARALLTGEFDQTYPRLSPDGRWLAYVSDESGREEVFVRSFPDLERKWQVSTGGGRRPHWRGDSRELAFTNDAGGEYSLWAVAVMPAGADLQLGDPERLFALPADVIDISAASDHQRFLALVQPIAAAEPALHLILGWNGGRRP